MTKQFKLKIKPLDKLSEPVSFNCSTELRDWLRKTAKAEKISQSRLITSLLLEIQALMDKKKSPRTAYGLELIQAMVNSADFRKPKKK